MCARLGRRGAGRPRAPLARRLGLGARGPEFGVLFVGPLAGRVRERITFLLGTGRRHWRAAQAGEGPELARLVQGAFVRHRGASGRPFLVHPELTCSPDPRRGVGVGLSLRRGSWEDGSVGHLWGPVPFVCLGGGASLTLSSEVLGIGLTLGSWEGEFGQTLVACLQLPPHCPHSPRPGDTVSLDHLQRVGVFCAEEAVYVGWEPVMGTWEGTLATAPGC